MPQLVPTPVTVPVDVKEAAATLAASFTAGAAERDRERRLPYAELDALSASGLLAITVPSESGGLDVPVSVVVDVIRVISAADPNIGQIPQSHFVYLEHLRHFGSPDLQGRIHADVLAGARIGNAQSEANTRHVRDIRTTLTPDGEGRRRLNGRKFYATGALFADWIPVLAHLGEDGPLVVAWVERGADGLDLIDDWDALGQRTTGSGSVVLSDVAVSDDMITPFAATFEGPQVFGAFAQVLHAAIDAGIARAAIRDAAAFVRERSRPYPDAGVDAASDDPLVVQAFGELELATRAAEALLGIAATTIENARGALTETSAAHASLAVAAARAACARAAVDASSRLFEVAGTRSAGARTGLDRHWRNARTHTLHDPSAWKVQHLGRWAVTGTPPPNHGQI